MALLESINRIEAVLYGHSETSFTRLNERWGILNRDGDAERLYETD